jgi:hypothetical protein
MQWKEFAQQMPLEMLTHIYEYDDTYRTDAYQQVIAEFHANQWLEWKRRRIAAYPLDPWIRPILDYILNESITNASNTGETTEESRRSFEDGYNEDTLETNISMCDVLGSKSTGHRSVGLETVSCDAGSVRKECRSSHDRRIRRLLWHHLPSIDVSCFNTGPDTEQKSSAFVVKIGDEYAFHGTIVNETWYKALWQNPREPPSPRIQQSITVYQAKTYRIMMH